MNVKPSKEIEKELRKFWGINELIFLAQFAINKQGKGYFRNIRKLNGDICFFPDNSKVNIPASNIDILETDREYIVSAFAAPEAKRRELGIEYLLYLDTKGKPPKVNQQTPREYVQKLYNQYQAAQGILKDSLSGAIKRLAVETNKKAETFIYEILQNADDYPDPIRKRVNIRFKIIENYLVVIHNGQSFRENNVYAICSVATGDKERDINKTGYKGIGFKSIFKHSNFAWIHSGDFSFRFDEVYHKRKGNETFWQLIPIWTEIERLDSVITTPDIINAPVAIIIRPKDGLHRLREYAEIFKRVFQDERVLLFLRSVESLSFQWNRSSFTKARSLHAWEISDLPKVEVPEELQERMNQMIDRSGDDRIPEKFKDLENTKITFATAKRDGKLIATDNTRIYAYLPTDLNFGFPFLINGDFIPDGSREKLFWDLEWNEFLFKQAGYVLIKWLKELYIKHQNASTTTLMPNLTRLITEELDEAKRHYIELFEEGFRDGIKETAFVPDTKGNLHLLNDLTIDRTGLLAVMGEDSFRKCTVIEEPFMATSFAASSIVDELMVKYELGKEFSKDNILGIINNDEFEAWLKIPSNNVAFLKLLDARGWLNEFSQHSLYLTEENELNDADSTYYDLGQDQSLLSWMKIPVLHPKLRDAFRATELLTLIYEPTSFIDNFILKNQSDIDSRLEDVKINVKFYQYLFKYSGKLPDNKFDREQLGYFKVLGHNRLIINYVNADNVYLLNSDLKKLILTESLPPDHIALIDPTLFCGENEIDNWKAFFAKFSVKEFTDTSMESFIRGIIVGRKDEIFTYFEMAGNEPEGHSLRRGNTTLWIFLHSALSKIPKANEKELKEAVSDLPIFTKEDGQLNSLKECYLPKEYTGNETLEKLGEQHPDIQITFVSDLYLTDKSLSVDKWASLFRTFHVKTDINDVLVHYLIPGINEFNEENLIAVTRLLFENRHFLKDKLSTLNLKLKTAEGSWLPAEEIIIGSYYSDNKLETQILPSLKLTNTVSTEYSKADLKKWHEFFKSLGALEYDSEERFIAAKIKQFIEADKAFIEDNEDLTFSVVKELIELNLSEKHFEALRSMLLILKGEGNESVYEIASNCHFASEYKAKLDLEEIIQTNERPNIFVSPNYLTKSGRFKDVKNFLKKIGVKEDFYFVKLDAKPRKEADPAYVLFVDNSNAKIKSNATSWAAQHTIKPWIYMPYLAYINVYSASVLFWEKIASNEKFLKIAFESFQYHCHFYTTTIPTYTEWYIKNTASIPARDGKCYKPSELYSSSLEKHIKNDSLLSKIDLKSISFGDKTLEERLGFRMNLTLDLCIERINEVENIAQLKKEGIWSLFIRLLNDNKLAKSETSSLNEFKGRGSLPNQLGDWKEIKELFFIQDDFDLGVGNSPHLIHDELKLVANNLGLTGLSRKDFSPQFKEVKNEYFKDILVSRLKYLALAENSLEWEVKTAELTEIIKPITFESTSRISFSYNDVNPPIQNTEKTFYDNKQVVYYVGNWRWARAAELFTFIHTLFKLQYVSLKILQDFLLLPDAEILDFFDEKNIKYPDSWKPMQSTPKNDTSENPKATSEPKDSIGQQEEKHSYQEKKSELSDEEITELEALLSRRLSDSEMANTLIVALYRALKYYENLGYNITAPKANIEECIRKRMLEGIIKTGTNQVIKVLTRSAKQGILHLNYQAWSDLKDAGTELFVVTGNNSSDYLVFADQESLSSVNKDSWVAKIGGDDKYAELSSLLNGEYLSPNKKFAPLQFLIRIKENEEYQSIFERIYSLEKAADFDELD